MADKSLLDMLSDRAFVRGQHLKKAIKELLATLAKVSDLNDYLTIAAAQNAAQNYLKLDVEQIEVPTTGGTVAMAAGTSVLIHKPATALAALTVNLSAVPTHSQRTIELLSTRAITSLTMGAGAATLRGPLTAIGANGFGRWRWIAADTTWLRCG